MPLNNDLREFIELLNLSGVEFLIVGAFAVAYYAALERFGFGSVGIDAHDFIVPGRVVQLGVKPNRIDLLTTISGVTNEAWASRETGELDGVPVAFIGRDALIKNKKSTGRAKDLGDAEELQQRMDDDIR